MQFSSIHGIYSAKPSGPPGAAKAIKRRTAPWETTCCIAVKAWPSLRREPWQHCCPSTAPVAASPRRPIELIGYRHPGKSQHLGSAGDVVFRDRALLDHQWHGLTQKGATLGWRGASVSRVAGHAGQRAGRASPKVTCGRTVCRVQRNGPNSIWARRWINRPDACQSPSKTHLLREERPAD